MENVGVFRGCFCAGPGHSPLVVKARCLGSLSLRCLMWGTHPSLPREKLLVWGSLMIVDYGTVSAFPNHLSVAFFLFADAKHLLS